MLQKIGHRGAQGYVAENTLASFQKAIDLGVDAIELDVHSCASGELVVFHDFTLGRMTDGVGEIHNFTLPELKELKVVNQYDIPTLEEVLLFVDRKCKVNIELKGHNTAKAACDLILQFIEDHNWLMSDFIVSSFQSDELEKMVHLNPQIPLAILTQASVEQAMEWAKRFGATIIHPHFSLLTEDNCKMAKVLGFQINTWTVNDPSDIERIKKWGVDGIISDYPDRI